jgi:hypothetical protein
LKFCILIVAAAMLLGMRGPAAAAEFPYDQDLLLDVKPLPGSKRVPILEIGADGRAQVDLWCRSGVARVAISGEAVTFTLGPLHEEGCTPERTARDEEMIAVLSKVTQWRLEEEDVILVSGSIELRFRLSTH